MVVRGEQLADRVGEAPLVLICIIDGCPHAERLQRLHATPDVTPARTNVQPCPAGMPVMGRTRKKWLERLLFLKGI